MILKNLKKFLTHKAVVAFLSFVIQIGIVLYLAIGLSLRITQIFVIMEIISVLIVLYLSTMTTINPKFVLSWTIVVLGVPIAGSVLYLLFGNRKMPKELLKKSALNEAHVGVSLKQDSDTLNEFVQNYPQYLRSMYYVEENIHYPVYANTLTKYYPLGELGYEAIKEDIKKAKKYIYVEYFIITPGKMWDEFRRILSQKAKEGVDVRLIYDDWGCPQFDKEYREKLNKQGIKAYPFNELSYRFAIQMNFRSHRKLVVVDGRSGFISGINIADEYINEKERFGHWKDNVVRIEGQAVLSLIEMFLIVWSYVSNTDLESIESYKEDIVNQKDDGYVQPFTDNPTDDHAVTETLHINAITNARHSVYICTPYLIIGYELLRALMNAAQSGVDVRIVLPGTPDKKIVYMITRSNYDKLLKAGVKVYEYTPGFIHQKTLIVDSELAIISTANMDYRSYYLNFECGISFYNSSVVEEAMDDFETIIAVSKEISEKEVKDLPLYVRVSRAIVGLFSGLM